MSTFDIVMPKMGESVEEATITRWFVSVGDAVKEDDPILEIATDKVDSEIPSPVAGVVKEVRFEVNAVVPVGQIVAVIALEGAELTEKTAVENVSAVDIVQKTEDVDVKSDLIKREDLGLESERFYSPLVRSIASAEGITARELDAIRGSGMEGRVTKEDVLAYLSQKKSAAQGTDKQLPSAEKPVSSASAAPVSSTPKASVSLSAGDEIRQMDRMRKLIADHMVMSKQVSPHVTSIVEADVTNIVLWREKSKDAFLTKYGEKLTYMPVFTEAVAKALRDFPGVNASVDGDQIIYRKNVNVGIAVSLPSGNLIVPVIKQADQKNLAGLASDINRLANEARTNKLSPDAIQGGTFTITNFGSFHNIIGTPIINQPQVAILATGTIEKKPAVIETPTGDVIAIRHKMFLSLSYDHRIVDGALGGGFLRRIADYLEAFALDTPI
ncbi:MAG: 2-oxo acid dehydrogenase subunit E2 [Marinilabiliaceae bacterium]|nr:2-oxo acid dehydrogenase subunit E2 [Marinilabiliaceae bacterium]